ncbi:hypothetical protein ACGO3R_11810 [Lactococcus lactis]
MINEKDIAEFFKLFSNDGRLKIISSLATDNLTVNEIVEKHNFLNLLSVNN